MTETFEIKCPDAMFPLAGRTMFLVKEGNWIRYEWDTKILAEKGLTWDQVRFQDMGLFVFESTNPFVCIHSNKGIYHRAMFERFWITRIIVNKEKSNAGNN